METLAFPIKESQAVYMQFCFR